VFTTSFDRIVVAVDPATTSSTRSDETGIVVVARDEARCGFVLADHSGKYAPAEWAALVRRLYRRWGADAVVVEVNQGGDMIEHTLRTADPDGLLKVERVRAADGKTARSEPVSHVYEQRRVFHVGEFTQLEEQMVTYDSSTRKSPDRLDALVWGFSELLVKDEGGFFVIG
jgi:phage terminase large subunit-like protein